MKKLVVYTRTCLSCTHKQKWRELRNFAREHDLEIEQRRVTRSRDWLAQSEQYEIDLPFIVNGNQAISLSEPLERLEEV